MVDYEISGNLRDYCSTEAERTALARLIRRRAGARPYVPVVVVPGDSEPELCGDRHHYVTPSGNPVRHPNAYRRAWGKPVYIHSTCCVEVGVDFLIALYSIRADALADGTDL